MQRILIIAINPPANERKEPALERLVFFSDAVVAIAITLLALDLHIDPTKDGHLHFSDIFSQDQHFAAFILSFLLITIFQNIIWDYVAVRKDYLDEKTAAETIYDFRFACNVAMIMHYWPSASVFSAL